MLRPDQAALLSVRLSLVFHVCAGVRHQVVEHRNVQVSRGERVTFTCDFTQMDDVRQIMWKAEGFYYSHFVTINATSTNFSSNKVTIDPKLPTTLTILKTQQEDEGVYRCESTTSSNDESIEWILTVSSVDASWQLFIIASVAGLAVLSCICVTLLCSRRLKTVTPNQDPAQELLTQSRYGQNKLADEKCSSELTWVSYIKTTKLD